MDRKELIKIRHQALKARNDERRRANAEYAQRIAQEVLEDEGIELDETEEMGEFPQS